jgi:Na+/proline symporter
VGGSVIATELVGRILAARSPSVARRSSYMAATLYVAIGVIPLLIGLMGPTLAPAIGDPEQLLPQLARDVLPLGLYAVFAGALISAILSTVDSTLLIASALASHNLVVPVFRVDDERTKVRLARGGVIVFGLLAYLLATRAEGVFALVEQASAFGSSGALVTVTFGLFTTWGGARAAIAALLAGIVTYLGATLAGATAPFLLSLLLSMVAYAGGAWLDRLFPNPLANRT